MYNKILVPVDVSHTPSGALALRAALNVAKGTDAKISLLAVVADVPNMVASQLPADFVEKAERTATDQLKAVAGECGLEEGSYGTSVRDGSTHHEILAEAESSGADLIVVASHRPELADYLLGSTAAKVVRHANCSVLVVRT